MKFYKFNIFNVVYRVMNDVLLDLPTSFTNVCIEMERDDNEFLFRQAAGMYIMNQTGYTPDNFDIEVTPMI